MKITGEIIEVYQKIIRNMHTVEFHLYGIIGTAKYPDMRKVRIIGFFFENWLFDRENKFIQTAILGYIFSYKQNIYISFFTWILQIGGKFKPYKGYSTNTLGARGGAVFKALRYKPAGRGFDSRWCHWNFSVTQSFRSHYGPGVDSASNRNEYQAYFLAVKAAGA
jgi:hypothetical protein